MIRKKTKPKKVCTGTAGPRLKVSDLLEKPRLFAPDAIVIKGETPKNYSIIPLHKHIHIVSSKHMQARNKQPLTSEYIENVKISTKTCENPTLKRTHNDVYARVDDETGCSSTPKLDPPIDILESVCKEDEKVYNRCPELQNITESHQSMNNLNDVHTKHDTSLTLTKLTDDKT